MDCKQFQKVLPYIIEGGSSPEEEAHLKSCPVCSDLVQDLMYIAEQAKLLVPLEEPHPRVWQQIRGSLEQEGLLRSAAAPARLRPARARWRWVMGAPLAAVAALLLAAAGLVYYHDGERAGTPTVQTAAAPRVSTRAQAADPDDAQLLATVQQRAPAMLATYKENLDSVNAYIADAKATVEQDPDDELARDHLLRAYDQKAMLYEMALSRSLE